MKPIIEKHTGNFETVQYVLMNQTGEILVELKDGGMIDIPGDYVLESDVDKEDVTNFQKYNLAAIDRLILDNLGVKCSDKKFVCKLFYVEDDKHFNCYYYICTKWDGEIPKLTKKSVRLMWVNKNFAKNLLSQNVDKEALDKMGLLLS